MRKIVSILLVSLLIVSSFTACSKDSSKNDTTDTTPTTAAIATQAPAPTVAPEEFVDGKFTETRKITVEVYDRNNDGGSDPANNLYTKYIHDGMLAAHNVDVSFVPVDRWTEDQQIGNLLAAGDAPDICLTYQYPVIQTYAGMGGVTDLGPLVDGYKDELPNLWTWLTDDHINYDRNPTYNTLWAIEARRAVAANTNTFVREDWLKKLNLAAPTTVEEFENMLIAFRDNASTLLGADADKMIPFQVTFDAGWTCNNLICSVIPDAITDRDWYVNGFDDRYFLQPNVKSAFATVNKWYNEDLVWKDFALYPAGDTTGDNLMKAGYIGSFIGNWDYPYRNGENGIQYMMQQTVGVDAAFVAIDPFKNDAGVYRKYSNGAFGDRKIFFPITNDEPLASMLYLDWISDPTNLAYLQFGDEGVTHEKQADGSFKTIAATGDAIMNSGNNIDYTMTCNGVYMADPVLQAKTIAYGYANVDPSYVEKAFAVASVDTKSFRHVNVGTIASESGMSVPLSTKRDSVLDQAIGASVADFDSIYDAGMADYLANGGQAIIDERTAAWTKFFGDATALPEAK